jgi:hypothetical protein
MDQPTLYKLKQNPHGEAWERAARRAGYGYLEVAGYREGLTALWKSNAPHGVFVSSNVAPIRATPDSPPTLPEPEAVIGREGKWGWVNQYDFCGGVYGRRVYPRGYPYTRRHWPDEYTPVDMTASPPSMALFSYVIGGANGGDMCAACRLVLPHTHEKIGFSEDKRLTGALVGPRSWAALGAHACVVARDAVPYWPTPTLTGNVSRTFGDVLAGYVLQMVCRAAGQWVGFGHVLPREGAATITVVAQLRGEADDHGATDHMAEAMDDYRRPETPLALPEAFAHAMAWLRQSGNLPIAYEAERWRDEVVGATTPPPSST